ncbi:hypothetical protein ABZ840_07540 [Streptomyces sp. NPDC047117]|uniref:hypothetical protein n=1 Tax=Streptomyces sp. NPDC047117 TaxID=3155379 RepID=UPI0033DB1CE7
MAHRLLQPLFRLSILVFLAGGVVTVLGQTLGIVLGDARWVMQVESSAQPPTCIAASICGILSFVLSYRRSQDARDDAENDRLPEHTANAGRAQ